MIQIVHRQLLTSATNFTFCFFIISGAISAKTVRIFHRYSKYLYQAKLFSLPDISADSGRVRSHPAANISLSLKSFSLLTGLGTDFNYILGENVGNTVA
jgi:hypothetical protein